jgi:hypothetical protein
MTWLARRLWLRRQRRCIHDYEPDDVRSMPLPTRPFSLYCFGEKCRLCGHCTFYVTLVSVEELRP